MSIVGHDQLKAINQKSVCCPNFPINLIIKVIMFPRLRTITNTTGLQDRLLILMSLCFLSMTAAAQRDNNNNYLDSLQSWSLHYQTTAVVQGHPGFRGGNYDGRNTLSALPDTTLSLTTTLFLGRRLWRGAALYVNPEIAGGRGVGHRDAQAPYDETLYTPAVGIAGFPNGETFRVGSPRPAVYLARLYLEQIIPLDDDDVEDVPSEANQVKQRLPASRIVLTAGKFSIADMFDNNAFAHDARVHFMNWSLMSMGAWDYPANTRGYTWGFAAEYIRPTYAVRLAGCLMPTTANGNILDWNVARSNGLVLELERQVRWLKRPGTVHLLGFRNVTKAPSYREATTLLQQGTYPTNPDYILIGRAYGGVKYGFGVSLEQPIGLTGGLFARVSWNDGHTATWAFTEIDRSYTIGTTIGGHRWKRPNDAIGFALIQNDLSADHAAFLNAGGYGFMIGDGRLPNYASERSLELFYKARLAHSLWITLDYQLVANPGYNSDRGPVSLLGLRTHVEF